MVPDASPPTPLLLAPLPLLHCSRFSVIKKPSVTQRGLWRVFVGSLQGELAGASVLGLQAERAPLLGTSTSFPCSIHGTEFQTGLLWVIGTPCPQSGGNSHSVT